MTRETEILTRAAIALAWLETTKRAVRAAEEDLRLLCREYEGVSGQRGLAIHHLARDVQAKGIEI
jgi:hypothetical protein